MIGSSGGGLAYVELGANDAASITVQYRTQAEFTAGTLASFCPPPATGKTINGDVAGAGFSDRSSISLGGREATVFTFIDPTFHLPTFPTATRLGGVSPKRS